MFMTILELLAIAVFVIWLGTLISAIKTDNEWLSEGCSGDCQQGRYPCGKTCMRKDKQNEQ